MSTSLTVTCSLTKHDLHEEHSTWQQSQKIKATAEKEKKNHRWLGFTEVSTEEEKKKKKKKKSNTERTLLDKKE